MSEQNATCYAGVGTASLSSGVDDDDPFVIHGVALGEGDVTFGKSRTRKKWTAEALRMASRTLEGRPLVKNHQNNADGRVGTVTKTDYEPGVGILYQAEIAPHYDELAKDVQSGIMGVSIRVYHPDVDELEKDEETDAFIVDAARSDNLSIVSTGASPSNTVEPGPHEELGLDLGAEPVATAQVADEPTTAVLSRAVQVPDDPAEVLAMGEGDMVSWDTDSSSGKGEIVSMEDGMATIQPMTQDDGEWVEDGETETMPEEVLEPWEPDEMDQHEMRPDFEAPAFKEGDWVKLQVRPGVFGQVVYIHRRDKTLEVDVFEAHEGELVRNGHSLTIGYNSVVPMEPDDIGMDELPDMDELGESNTDSHTVAEDDWVQWYPSSGPEEAHGKVERIDEAEDDSDEPKVVVRMYTQDDDGTWHPTDHTKKLEMDEVEGWGNYPTDDAISDERLGEGVPEALASESRKSEGEGEDKADGEKSDEVKQKLKNKRDEHNDKHGDEEGKKVTYTMLEKVYDKGLAAYQNTHRPGMTPNQWAMARVNAFLYLVRNGQPENDEYTQDNSLLPDGHPKKSSSENAESVPADLTGYEADLTGDELAKHDDQAELDEVYSDWDDAVNMTADELRRWAENPCAQQASVDPKAVIKRNLELIETDKADWTSDHVADAKRTISFVERMSDEANEPDEPMDGPHGCPSEWAISLLNWAHNPLDSIPGQPDEGDMADKTGYDELSVTKEDTPGDEDEEYVSATNLAADHDDMYESESDAQERAEEIGCMTVHEHEVDGQTMYMPCGDMSTYEDKVGEMGKHGESDEYSGCCGADMVESESLAEGWSVHEPSYDGTHEGEWDRPDMEDFVSEMDADADSWDDLTEDQRSAIADHFILADGGFPGETFGDLYLPVVEPSGELSLSALRTVKGGHGAQAVDGLDSDHESKIMSMVNDLAESAFDEDWADDEEEMSRTHDVARVANRPGTAVGDTDGSSTVATLEHSQTMNTTIDYDEADEEQLDELSEPVVVERDDLEALREEADQGAEVQEELSELRDEVGEFADARGVVESLTDAEAEQLTSDTDVEIVDAEELAEQRELVDEVGEMFAEELADHSPFEAEELTDRFSPLELRDRVQDHDEAELGEEIESEPEPRADDTSTEELNEAEQERTEEDLREAAAEELEQMGWANQAESVREGDIDLDELGFEIEA
jgi:hypothetical protein